MTPRACSPPERRRSSDNGAGGEEPNPTSASQTPLRSGVRTRTIVVLDADALTMPRGTLLRLVRVLLLIEILLVVQLVVIFMALVMAVVIGLGRWLFH